MNFRMKTKLIPIVYRGRCSVDPRFSASMLKWTVNDIRILETFSPISICLENGVFEGYNQDFELQLNHNLKHVVGICRIFQKNRINCVQVKTRQAEMATISSVELSGPSNGMVTLIKNPKDPLLHVHLFEWGEDFVEITELINQIRDPHNIHPLSNSVGSIPQTLNNTSRSISAIPRGLRKGNELHSTPASNLKLIEATKNSQPDYSPNIVSSKMSGSKSYTQGLSSAGTIKKTPPKIPSSQSMKSNLSIMGDISPNHTHFFEVMYVGKIRVSHKRVPCSFIDDALPKFKAYDAKKQKLLNSSQSSLNSENDGEESAKPAEDTAKKKVLMRGISQYEIPIYNDIPKVRDRSASQGSVPTYMAEQNRTMVFLIGKSDLRLISPDRKQVLLYKELKDVASCAQGQKNANFFGIICRETPNLNNSAVSATSSSDSPIQQGFIGYVFKCQNENVCDDIISAISQAFVTCSEQKKKESQVFSCDNCPMLYYHKLCSDLEDMGEKKTNTIILKRIEQLSETEQEMIWAKFDGAGKSSSDSISDQNQFLMMLLRAHCEARQQNHVHDVTEGRSDLLNLSTSTIFKKAKRSLTSSFDHLLKRKITSSISVPSISEYSGQEESEREPRSSVVKPDPLKSPMMDIFMKVGNSPKDINSQPQGSWRQAILNSVVTPSKAGDNEFMTPVKSSSTPKRRTTSELKELWKIAIRQTILLSRMEKENAALQAKQSENEMKKMKLGYDSIIPCDKEFLDFWETVTERDVNSLKSVNKKDTKLLYQAIKNGIPRQKRGDVWKFLAEQHSLNSAPPDPQKFPNFNTPYKILLKSLTEHQHAIFIDLGRTFPNHMFYKDPLGVGQLSLFNLLKAYSILDPELGYCQGLGFICGVLLLHCEEEDAFELLKHLMFRRKMRTKYLPDMKEFQLQLYQLSRLVKDYLPDLYEWLDQNESSPTLYAAPWILTIFSSQFPLGFVARVFDFLFHDSSDVIFKFAIGLLTVHKDELMNRDNFEHIMEYLRVNVPNVDAEAMEKILNIVNGLDINKQLNEYNVEYNVLQEEMTSSNHHMEMFKKEQSKNRHLETQLQFAQSNIAQLEKTRNAQQTQIHKLQTGVSNLEENIRILGRYVRKLMDDNSIDKELSSEVRRIIQNLEDVELQDMHKKRSPRMVKSLSMNSSLGFSSKPLENITERTEESLTPRPNVLLKESQEDLLHISENSENMDSGIETPTPPTSSISSTSSSEEHPLSMCGEVNVKFNGTQQLKSTKHFLSPTARSKSFHQEVENNNVQ